MTKQEFITAIAGAVQKYAYLYGIEVHSPIIAQAILESGWGETKLAKNYHNYFGLKCGTRWTGKSVNLSTKEEYSQGTLTTIRDNFRVYDSLEDGVKGYFEFLQLPRYENLRGIRDPEEYLKTIRADAYATDYSYVEKNMKLICQYELTKYDGNRKEEETVMLSNSGHDERNKYSGGKAGDQTGGEWARIPWYNRPWLCVLRHPDAQVRKEIAKLARAAADNNLIGYDQNERYTFWQHLKASDYDPAKITVACEADCSAGVAAIVKAVGYRRNIKKLKDVSIYLYTGNMRAGLKAAGFEVLVDTKYRTSDTYLMEGDILLNDYHHTAICLDDGKYVEKGKGTQNQTTTSASSMATSGGLNRTPQWVGRSTVNDLNVRTWAGTEYKNIKSWPKLNAGNQFDVCDSVKDKNGKVWYYVRIAGKYYGFIASWYVERV